MYRQELNSHNGFYIVVMRCHIENGKEQIRERNRLKKGPPYTYRLKRRQTILPYLFTVHLKWNSFTGVLIVSSSDYLLLKRKFC